MKHCVQATLLCLLAALGCPSAFAKPVHGFGDDELFGDGSAMLRRIMIAEAAADLETNIGIAVTPLGSPQAGIDTAPTLAALPQIVDLMEPNAVPGTRLLSADPRDGAMFQSKMMVACVGTDCFRARSGSARPIVIGTSAGNHAPLINPEPAPFTLLPLGGLALLAGRWLRRGRA